MTKKNLGSIGKSGEIYDIFQGTKINFQAKSSQLFLFLKWNLATFYSSPSHAQLWSRSPKF